MCAVKHIFTRDSKKITTDSSVLKINCEAVFLDLTLAE